MHGFPEVLHVFAEPNSPVIEQENTIYHHNDHTYGCFANFSNAVVKVLKDNPGEQYFLYLQDDIMIGSAARQAINGAMQMDYTHTAFWDGVLLEHDINRSYRPGWNILTKEFTWCCGFMLMTRHFLERFITHGIVISHLAEGNNKAIDVKLGQVGGALGLHKYIHHGSLGMHIGLTSTLGHRPISEWNAVQFKK